MDFYLTAYDELLSDRAGVGFDVGLIPWSSIVAWAQLHGVTDPDGIATVVYHVRNLEQAAEEADKQQEETAEQ